MSARNDGGPAFPVVGQEWNSGAEEWRIASTGGMSLRDYFAAKAMQSAIVGATMPEESWPKAMPLISKFSYQMADAMLRARDAA